MERQEIITWLQCEDETKLQELWQQADSIRESHVGNAVHLRGLLEISNICARDCHYCGIRAGNDELERYRMPEDEIMECVQEAVDYNYGTVVLQAGEDYGITREWLASLIRRIKKETQLAVTLSLGERSDEDLVAWKEARTVTSFASKPPTVPCTTESTRRCPVPNRTGLLCSAGCGRLATKSAAE
jgi:biotin synthase